jgi:hypothetical protein
MRIGEALALIGMTSIIYGRFINVERGFSMGNIETPKSGKGRKNRHVQAVDGDPQGT